MVAITVPRIFAGSPDRPIAAVSSLWMGSPKSWAANESGIRVMVLPESKRAWVVIFSKLMGTSFRSVIGNGVVLAASHRLILAGIGDGQSRSGSEAMLLMLSTL